MKTDKTMNSFPTIPFPFGDKGLIRRLSPQRFETDDSLRQSEFPHKGQVRNIGFEKRSDSFPFSFPVSIPKIKSDSVINTPVAF